jgi:hypothetical protein
MELNEFQKLTLPINQVIQGYLFKDGLKVFRKRSIPQNSYDDSQRNGRRRPQ